MVKKRVHEYGNGITWTRRRVLGQGYFGRVFLATANNRSSIDNNLPPQIAVKSVNDEADIHMESAFYRKIQDCPYIIRYFGEEMTTRENGEMVYNLLLEYCSGGTLKQKIINDCGLPEIEARFYIRSILRGINHLHSLMYVHCDIKPDNILLVPNKFRAKICDFGWAKSFDEYRPYWRGTPKFLSPEAICNGVQGAPADIWAFGCVVLELLTGKPAWDNCLHDEEVMRRVGSEGECPHIPDEISEEARVFLNGCFQREPMQRSTAEMLLQHQFVGDLSDDEVNVECDDVNYDDFNSDDDKNNDDMVDYSHEHDDPYEDDDDYKCNAIAEQKNDIDAIGEQEDEDDYNDAIGEEHDEKDLKKADHEDDYDDAIGKEPDDQDLKAAENSLLLKNNRFFTWFYNYFRIRVGSFYYTMFSRIRGRE